MRRKLFYAAASLSMIFVLVSGASVGLVNMIQHGVGAAAERDATQWVQFLTTETPELVVLLQSDNPAHGQLGDTVSISAVSDVYRFELFNQRGEPVLAVDHEDEHQHFGAESHLLPHGLEHNQTIQQILGGGQTQSFIHQNTADPSAPDYYDEAYTPILSDDQVVGVAVIYVDKTAMYRMFTDAAIEYGVIMSVIFSAALGGAYFIISHLRERQKKAKRSIEYLANFDTVSGLLNRDAFFKTVTFENDAACTALLYADVDNFKSTNDVFGHQGGDAFLGHVGEAIGRCIGAGDFAARVGGDEFVAVISAGSPEGIVAIVERIQEEIKAPVHSGGLTITGGISIGIYMVHDKNASIADCLHKADMALYQAKADGRGVHRTFNLALEASVERRQKVERAVRKGCELDLFTLQFQPLLNQASNKCVGFEALLRLTDLDGEQIGPLEFIPVAESIGEIERIGTWVLEAAMREAVNWPSALFVSVNLSVRQFDSLELVGIIKRLLAETGLAPARLELEVTESLLMHDSDKIGQQLVELRELGISIAMDDFGTGYSSLGYLWKFGFDKLKIDRSFIIGLEGDDGRASDILDAIIALGHRLNMLVTAEGIETKEQAAILSSLSCDQFQGFYFGRPMWTADIAPFLLTSVAEQQGPAGPDRGSEMPPARRAAGAGKQRH